MKKTDLAYYAGIFDGEGTIGIYAYITSVTMMKLTQEIAV